MQMKINFYSTNLLLTWGLIRQFKNGYIKNSWNLHGINKVIKGSIPQMEGAKAVSMEGYNPPPPNHGSSIHLPDPQAAVAPLLLPSCLLILLKIANETAVVPEAPPLFLVSHAIASSMAQQEKRRPFKGPKGDGWHVATSCRELF